ncbi:cysteine-type deubiquitinase [Emydomyces testavorans]|uniref:Ubiquitin carboxyl-terminal hydrolase n=1 Tax=Emydomyces testavorans TaxID=2070801 RepID=A0AAF0DCS3_9EURO|nr:cysteine-type deubiquitinase [Emydomyces testavorans]
MTGTEQRPDVEYINGKKTFVPLENNPEVMSHLIHHLGVSPKLGFYDVYSIDDQELLSFIPRPVYGLIFICHGDVYHRARDAEEALMKDYEGSGPHEPVLWFKQTIGNACGLMALLHCISNGPARQYIQPGSDLDKLLEAAVPLSRMDRAKLLYDSPALEAAHRSAAQRGDTQAPTPGEKCGFHFISFVKGDDGRLWELNGSMKGPVSRGALGADEDCLSEHALDLGVRTFIGKKSEAGEADFGFSLVALAPNME